MLKSLSAMGSTPPDSTALTPNFSIAAVSFQDSNSRSLPFLHQYAIHEINTILWALFIVTTGVLLKRVGQLFWLWILGSRISGPPSSALSGHSSSIAKAGGRDGFNAFLSKLHKEYGPIVRLWLGPTQLLVSIKDPSLAEEVLLRAKDRLPSIGKALHLAYGRSTVFSASFTEANKRRSLFNEELNGKVMGRVEAICQKVIRQLKLRASVDVLGAEVDCKSVSQHLAFSVLGMALFGESFLSWSAVDEFRELLLLIANEACFWSNFSIMPFWNQRFRTYRNNCLKLKRLTEDIIAKCRQDQSKSGAPRHTRTASCFKTSISETAAGHKGTGVDLSGGVISGLASSCDWLGLSNSNSIEEVRGSHISMMFHGSLTTAAILGGVLMRLAQCPFVQAKIHAEIDNVCGTKSPPMLDDVKRLHYLMATLHESARLLPSGPLLQRCSPVHDIRLGQGLILPAGAVLAVPVQLIQMEKCSWGQDAEEFNPDRFLCRRTDIEDQSNLWNEKRYPTNMQIACQSIHGISKEGEEKGKAGSCNVKDSGVKGDEHVIFKDPSGNPSFLLFGTGPRSCVGKSLAINEMMMMLAILLQEFQPSILPLQILRIGNMVTLCVPSELTTMAGRRLREAVKEALLAKGTGDFNNNTIVVIAGLTNSYSQYVTTFEEYQVQRYEGASTLYGPHTLSAYIQEFTKLATAMAGGENVIERGPSPPDLLEKQIELLPGVVYDDTPGNVTFGDVIQDVPPYASFKVGDVVSASFWSGSPRNDLFTEKTFSLVEMRDIHGNWNPTYDDDDLSVLFLWGRPKQLSPYSHATIRWEIPDSASAGTYRLRHFGAAKPLLSSLQYFNGSSSAFVVSK